MAYITDPIKRARMEYWVKQLEDSTPDNPLRWRQTTGALANIVRYDNGEYVRRTVSSATETIPEPAELLPVSYCCLGVGSEICHRAGGTQKRLNKDRDCWIYGTPDPGIYRSTDNYISGTESYGELPKDVADWYGMTETDDYVVWSNPVISHSDDDHSINASEANDHLHLSFPEIGALFRATFLTPPVDLPAEILPVSCGHCGGAHRSSHHGKTDPPSDVDYMSLPDQIHDMEPPF